MTSRMLLELSKPQFPHVRNGLITVLNPQGCYEDCVRQCLSCVGSSAWYTQQVSAILSTTGGLSLHSQRTKLTVAVTLL